MRYSEDIDLVQVNPGPIKALMIKSVGSDIVIRGTEPGEIIQLYSIDGMLLDSVRATEGETTIRQNLQRGVTYIIRYGNKAIKYKH